MGENVFPKGKKIEKWKNHTVKESYSWDLNVPKGLCAKESTPAWCY
jgi:hypothetical protein